mmetsp:Transcript_9565/g.28553  ORF Transcript_9565/g.28553 Transcript_9565/m.28553 type:complete len:246 (+) Transcript_9565:166-903(+)|eukprot:CAMPEP_0172368512 /NCGR_PEP_ID=MMETSP1060-20121228/27652_1 /TAXON_ID=37318 /ORGANISM="Pseudo-nitzschia pungens, Strain cf. cingulata" /LENGTH=245 /DNA_ID=CAMNT_0013093129 /DNA_START=73 /DNA_END=810 /DNA_ORIENTATION=+
MTSAVNLVDIRNLSLICRQGPETFAHLCKSSPFHASTIFSPTTKSSDVAGTTSLPLHEDHQQQPSTGAIQTPDRNDMRQQRSGGSRVRFEEAIPDRDGVVHESGERRRPKRKKFDSSDSVFWWTKEELGEIQQSCVDAVKSYEFGLPIASGSSLFSIEDHHFSSLERYSLRNRKRRKIVRLQMRETIRAVEEFERATKTKTPPEMLAQLLRRHSASKALEAKNRALRMAASCAMLQGLSTTTKRT